MPRSSIAPTTLERPFELAELFFSTTDPRGMIRSGNAVFARVSGYPESELIGQPHNIIRHPDMPRAVFQLLWDYIEAGRTIAAYVKNLAKDGAYYWVLATVIPIQDGYLSVRLKPSAGLLPTVEALYAELRAMERDCEASGGTPKEAIAAATEHLVRRLPELGFGHYDAFMRAALPAELRSRRAALGHTRGRTRMADDSSNLAGALAATGTLHDFLTGQFARLDDYSRVNEVFAGSSAQVLHFADTVRLFSLNAQIGAARLLDSGAALGVIADLMRLRADATAAAIREMKLEIDAVVTLLDGLAFTVSIATIESEMAAQFVSDLAAGTSNSQQRAVAGTSANVRALAEALRTGIGPVVATLSDLDTHLDRVASCVESLTREFQQLDALQVAGRVESARLEAATEFRLLFEEIRSQVTEARQLLRTLSILDTVRAGRVAQGARDDVVRDLEYINAWAAAA